MLNSNRRVASLDLSASFHCEGPRAHAENLSREFSAPVGIFHLVSRDWEVVIGADHQDFPPIDDQLLEVARSSGLRLGRVAIWPSKDGRDQVWLVIPLPSREFGETVAFVGFVPFEDGHRRTKTDERESDVASVQWGPACPDPALRAWGQQVANRYYKNADLPAVQMDGTGSNEQESERVVIGRLIRRMRISDSPGKFQGLATNVLRTSLNMAAVAWVPNNVHDPITVSGSLENLRSPSFFRSLVPPTPSEVATINNDAKDHRIAGEPGIERYASVPAGNAGWLIVVNPLHDQVIGTPEVERIQYVASLIASQLSNARIYAELKELLFGIIRALTAAIDAKDQYTSGHSERVARIAVRLAEEMGVPPQKRSDLYLAGLLHDIGKIGIDDDVLKKRGKLTSDEYRKIQSHVEIGVKILRDLKTLHHILPGVRHHHESLNGKGYPDHLSGDEIPLEARILAVADSFDAMSSNRHYRNRLTPGEIDRIFREGKGSQWDPAIVDALFACRNDLEAIRQKGLGESLIGAVDVALGRT